MEVAFMAEQSYNVAEGSLRGGKSMKKKKSLKQLLIPSRQKSLNLRSVSAPGNPQSAFHSLDDHPLPRSARAFSGTPAKTFSVMFNERKSVEEENKIIVEAVDKLWPVSKAGNTSEARASTNTTQSLSKGSAGEQIPHPVAKASVPLAEGSLRSAPLFDQRAPEIPPKSRQRSTTDVITKLVEKPAHYVPQSGTNQDPGGSTQPVSHDHEPNSPLSFQQTPRTSSTRFTSVENFKDIGAHLPEQCQRVPWNPTDDVRESMQSGQTTNSSFLDSAGTKHSSIFTKNSMLTNTTVDAECGDEPKRSMTVDDAIDLYLAGFEDDEPTDVGNSKSFLLEEDPKSRSDQIAEAVGEPVGSMLSSPEVHNVNPPSRASSTAIVSGKALQSWFHSPPPLQKPTDTHDQYGFRKASQYVSLDAYDSWYSSYLPNQERRIGKWFTFMQGRGLPTTNPTKFPARSDKTQKFVRKGIPPAWRGEAWFFYAGGNGLLLKRPGYYSELVLKCQTPALLSSDKEAIERDLHRSFPDNIHFKPEPTGAISDGNPISPTEMPIVSALRRLLQAFSIHYPGVGYCQSLNFIGGFLLLFLPEEKAFWMLHIITTRLLPGTHERDLDGVDIDTWAMLLALRDQNPSLWAKIKGDLGDLNIDTKHLPSISACATPWFMNAFLGNLPTESVLRVWDMLFYDGVKTLFRIALAIFKCGEDEIKKMQDPSDALQYVQSLPRQMLDVASLFEVALGRGELGHRFIDLKRQERKEYHIKRHAAEESAKREAGIINGEDSDTWPTLDLSRPAMLAEEPASPLQRTATKSRYKQWFSKSSTKVDAS